MDDKKKIEFSLKRRLEAFESQYGKISDTIQKKVNNLSHYPEKNDKYFENVKNW